MKGRYVEVPIGPFPKTPEHLDRLHRLQDAGDPFCGTCLSDHPEISVDTGDESLDWFCGWECLASFATSVAESCDPDWSTAAATCGLEVDQ